MLKRFLLLAAIASAMNACKPHQPTDGTYLIYQIDERHPEFMDMNLHNDTINATLKNHFLNKKYQISFQQKFATLHPVNEQAEIVLAKQEYSGHVSYYQRIDKGIGELDYTLKADTDNSLLMEVVLHLRKRQPLVMPVQMPTNDTSRIHGIAICHLSKIQ